jgi:hypothetical protein
VMTLLSASDLSSLMVKRLESFSTERSAELRRFGRNILAICCKVDGGIGFEKRPLGGWYCWSNPLVVHSNVSPAHVMLGETCFSTYRFHPKSWKAPSRSSNNFKISKSEIRCLVLNTSSSGAAFRHSDAEAAKTHIFPQAL